MVVDALRSDFVYGNTSNFLFTQSLIRSGAAVPFTGHASPPTITMPRVKAITTGSVPSFVDLILNFAESDTTSTLKEQDTWLAQLRAKGGKLVMYGDDTWLRLFPDFFHRSDGTTSFFVSDFTEVDNNVTRHIPEELANDDWSAMTLHFLGLDHIGHKTGPKGPNMPAKQAEMDGIVKDIYTAMESQDHLKSCLLVLLGDHGMNEGGNHGASSPGEVSTALTFISPQFKSAFEGLPCPIDNAVDYKYYNAVEQSDIVPSLAALLGFPVPLNNLGVVIPQLLELWPQQEDRHALLYENAIQVHKIAEATFPNAFETLKYDSFCPTPREDDAEFLACMWAAIVINNRLATTAGEPWPTAIDDLKYFLYEAQRLLSGTASNYDLASMQIGIALSALAFFLCLPYFTSGILQAGFDGLVLGFIMLSHSITMFATSYVEEEHQFWYWSLAGYLAILFFRASRFELSHTSASQTACLSGRSQQVPALAVRPLRPLPPLEANRPEIRRRSRPHQRGDRPERVAAVAARHAHLRRAVAQLEPEDGSLDGLAADGDSPGSDLNLRDSCSRSPSLRRTRLSCWRRSRCLTRWSGSCRRIRW